MQVLNESSGFLMELIHLLLLDIITYQSLASLSLSTHTMCHLQFHRHNTEAFQHINLQLHHHQNLLQATVALIVLLL